MAIALRLIEFLACGRSLVSLFAASSGCKLQPESYRRMRSMTTFIEQESEILTCM